MPADLAPSQRALRRAIFEEMRASDLMEPLRSEYVRVIREHNVDHVDHLLERCAWLVYVFYGRLVSRLLPSRDARIVDWGGQYGQVTQILRTLGFHDVSNYLLAPEPHYEEFQSTFSIPTIRGEHPNRLALPDGSVDGFISSGVLEHVRDDGVGREDLVLAEVRRVLRPGGLFFLWNFPTLLGTSEILATIFGKWRHIYRYRRRDVVALLAGAGLETVYLDRHKWLPGDALRLLERILPSLTLYRLDDRLSRLFPFSVFARDFAAVARKPLG
ncbi:MAG: class I SAM-dependent methyltransferase [Planctomycetales bacterium]|nr:class I SAM-dependent methyltransferase [Planctomycetales bacterium]